HPHLAGRSPGRSSHRSPTGRLPRPGGRPRIPARRRTVRHRRTRNPVPMSRTWPSPPFRWDGPAVLAPGGAGFSARAELLVLREDSIARHVSLSTYLFRTRYLGFTEAGPVAGSGVRGADRADGGDPPGRHGTHSGLGRVIG